MTTLYKILASVMSPADKTRILANVLKSSKELEAVLVLASYYNKPVQHLMNRGRILTFSGTPNVVKPDVSVGVNYLLSDSNEQILISEATFKLCCYVLSLTAIGITAHQVSSLLLGSTMTVKQALMILDIDLQVTSKIVPTCACCNRQMKSVDETGLCNGCESYLPDFLPYRVEKFEIPLNTFNFKYLEGEGNDLPINFSYTNYHLSKGEGVIIATPGSYDGYKFRAWLPFEEYAKPIVTLSKS